MKGLARFAPLAIVLLALTAGAAEDHAPPWEKPLREGRYLYLENCSVCHSSGKPKRAKFGPSLFRLFQNEKLPLTRGKPTDEYVAAKIKNGGPIMPAFGGYLSDRQIATLIAYIRSLH